MNRCKGETCTRTVVFSLDGLCVVCRLEERHQRLFGERKQPMIMVRRDGRVVPR